jgi:hypothetical protein
MGVLDRMERAVNEAIVSGSIPGGVLWIERNGVDFEDACGYRALVPQPEPMTRDTISGDEANQVQFAMADYMKENGITE